MFGCFWFLIALLEDHEGTWTVRRGVEPGGLYGDPQTQYIMAVYWSMQTMYTIGFGDVRATTRWEYAFAAVSEMVGAFVFSYIVGNMSMVAEVLRPGSTLYEKTLASIEHYCKENTVPKRLRARVQAYFQAIWKTRQFVDEELLLAELSPDLRVCVLRSVQAGVVENLDCFRFMTPQIKNAIIQQMKPQLCSEGDAVYTQGEVGRELFIVSTGTVGITTTSSPLVTTLYKGQYFGELALWTRDERKETVTAGASCTLLTLSKQQVDHVLSEYSAAKKQWESYWVNYVQSRPPGRQMSLSLSCGVPQTPRASAGAQAAAETKSRFVVSPRHPVASARLLVMCAAVAWCLVVVPFHFAFDSREHVWMHAVDACVDLLFVLDVVFQFSLGFFNQTEVSLNRALITRRYLRQWFIFDVISCFPVGILSFSIAPKTSTLLLPWLLGCRFLRLFRCFHVVRVTRDHVFVATTSYYGHITSRIAKFAITASVLAHWFGCLLLSLVHRDELVGTTEYTWEDRYRVSHLLGEQASGVAEYIISLYWAVASMSTVGYGDVVPSSNAQRVFALLCMMVGTFVLAFILESLTVMFRNSDNSVVARRRAAENLREYIKSRQFPKDLQDRLFLYFQYSWQTRKRLDAQLLSEMSHSLRSEVVYTLYHQVIVNVPLFRGGDTLFISSLLMSLKSLTFAPLEVVIREGSMGRDMFMIVEGKVRVSSNGTKVCSLRSGDYFGEIAMLRDVRRTASVTAVTFCDIFSLSRKEYDRISGDFPEIAQKMRAAAEARTRRTEKVIQRWKNLGKTKKRDDPAVPQNTSDDEPKSPATGASDTVIPFSTESGDKSKRTGGGPPTRLDVRDPPPSATDFQMPSTARDTDQPWAGVGGEGDDIESAVQNSDAPRELAVFRECVDVGTQTTVPWSIRFVNQWKQWWSQSSTHQGTAKHIWDLVPNVLEHGRSGFVIHPHSPLRRKWDFFIALLLLFIAIALPYKVAFDLLPWGVGAFAVLETVIDFLFLADVGINFYTGVLTSDRGIVMSPHEIRALYLKTYFTIDLLSSLPLNLLMLPSMPEVDLDMYTWHPTSFEVTFRLIRLVKLLRLSRSGRILHRFEQIQGVRLGYMEALRFLTFTFCLMHVCACVWFFTAAVQGFTAESWTGVAGINPGMADATTQYMVSLYWSAQTICTVGYGDIHAETVPEYLVSLVCMWLGAFMFSYIVASISDIQNYFGAGGVLYREKMLRLYEYCRANTVPLELQVRIHEYFRHCWESRKFVDEKTLLAQMSAQLRGEVMQTLTGGAMSKVEMFMKLGPEFTFELLTRLEPHTCAPGDCIIQEGEMGRDMYVLGKGRLAVFVNNVRVATLTAGACFGEIALLYKTKRTATIKSLLSSDFFSLSKDAFEQAVREFPEATAYFEELAAARLSELIANPSSAPCSPAMRSPTRQPTQKPG